MCHFKHKKTAESISGFYTGKYLSSKAMDGLLAGLLLFIPALVLPILGIRAVGTYNEASLLECVLLLINSEFYLVALCVFMFTIAIPLVRLISAFYLCLQLKRNRISKGLLVFFRSYHRLDNWAMLHIFFLGIVISIYKLLTMATLSMEGGLIALLLLLFCATFISTTLDHHFVWQKLEESLVPTR